MAATLTWTETAIGHLCAIAEYIDLDSETRAAHVLAKIVESAEKLKRFSRQGRVVPEFDCEDIRELHWRKYRIVYRIAAEEIAIVAVIHGARRLEEAIGNIDIDN